MSVRCRKCGRTMSGDELMANVEPYLPKVTLWRFLIFLLRGCVHRPPTASSLLNRNRHPCYRCGEALWEEIAEAPSSPGTNAP